MSKYTIHYRNSLLTQACNASNLFLSVFDHFKGALHGEKVKKQLNSEVEALKQNFPRQKLMFWWLYIFFEMLSSF